MDKTEVLEILTVVVDLISADCIDKTFVMKDVPESFIKRVDRATLLVQTHLNDTPIGEKLLKRLIAARKQFLLMEKYLGTR